MNLHQCILTNNRCFKRNVEQADSRYADFQRHGPQGLMLHSTGANNPYIHRYVAPDDGILGPNPYGNDWNRDDADLDCCVAAFIGLTNNDEVATYQTLPWNFRNWHCGGAANNTHLGVEICEDGLDDPEYFEAVYQEAVELFAMLCKRYDLDPLTDIICHAEGARMGVASNHADVEHWFGRFGRSMDDFRAAVQQLVDQPDPKPLEPPKRYKSLEEMPEYYREEISRYIEHESLKGRGPEKGLDLSEDMARLLVVLSRELQLQDAQVADLKRRCARLEKAIFAGKVDAENG